MPAVSQLKLNRPKRVVYQELVALALKAADNAFPPFSDYRVGCAVLLWDGRVYLGVNTENPAIGLTIHGEMSAINAAITDGALNDARSAGLDQYSFIRAIAVIPLRSFEAWPCGHCRDFIAGFGLGMDVVVRKASGQAIWRRMSKLLPCASQPAAQVEDALTGRLLVKHPGCIAPPPHRVSDVIQLPIGAESRRSLLALAKQASRYSYAPYSKRPAGAAIQLWDGRIYTGCRVENVGYTLSNDPEQVAVNAAIADGALEHAIRNQITPKQFIRALAYHVPGRPNSWPSGSSRQCLCDFGTAIEVIAEDAREQLAHQTLAKLLPGAFVPDVLSYWTTKS
jgi:cytidine deaminase